MDKMYCTNCGAEFQLWELEDRMMCLGCWSKDGYYYGTEAGMMTKMMRIEKNSWRKDFGKSGRKIGLN